MLLGGENFTDVRHTVFYQKISYLSKNFLFLEKSDVSKIWSGQKAGEDANETKVHDEAKKQHQS